MAEYQDKLGGLTGAIARAADDVLDLDALPPDELEVLRKAFLGLVRVDERGRFARRVALWDGLPAHARLEQYAQARLLVSDADDQGRRTLEVAHEALFRSWPALVEWLSQSRNVLRMAADVERASESWFAAGHPDDRLWHGGRLTRVQEYVLAGDLELPQGAARFVAQSLDKQRRDEARRKRRQRTLVVVSTVVAATMVVLGGIGLWQAFLARESRDKAASSLAVLRDLRSGNPRAAIQGAAALEIAQNDADSMRLLYQVISSQGNAHVVLGDQSDELRLAQVQGGWAYFRSWTGDVPRHVLIDATGHRAFDASLTDHDLVLSDSGAFGAETGTLIHLPSGAVETLAPAQGAAWTAAGALVVCRDGALGVQGADSALLTVDTCGAWAVSPSEELVAAVSSNTLVIARTDGETVSRSPITSGTTRVLWGPQGVFLQTDNGVLFATAQGVRGGSLSPHCLQRLDASGNAVVTDAYACGAYEPEKYTVLDARGRPVTPRGLQSQAASATTGSLLAWAEGPEHLVLLPSNQNIRTRVDALEPFGDLALVQVDGVWTLLSTPSLEYQGGPTQDGGAGGRPALDRFPVECDVTDQRARVVDTETGASVAIFPPGVMDFGGRSYDGCGLVQDASGDAVFQAFVVFSRGSSPYGLWSLPTTREGLLARAHELAGDPDACLLSGSLRPRECDD